MPLILYLLLTYFSRSFKGHRLVYQKVAVRAIDFPPCKNITTSQKEADQYFLSPLLSFFNRQMDRWMDGWVEKERQRERETC